jgi:hypothetical protein
MFFDRSPAIGLPLRFLFAGPVFGVLAALLLFWEGPAELATRWAPASLAGVHLLTLGFLAVVMVGASLQISTVLTGQPLAIADWLVTGMLVLLIAGTLALVGGFLTGIHVLSAMAVACLAVALALFLFSMWRQLWAAARQRDTVGGMLLALAALAVAAALGLRLAAGWAWPSLGIPRFLTDVHLRWALFGWVGMLVAAVSFEVVPMFQFTPPYPQRMRRILLWLVALSLVAGSFAPVLHGGLAERALSGLPLVFLCAFAVITLTLQHRSRREVGDTTLRYFRLAMGSLLGATALWALAPWSGRLSSQFDIAALLLYLVGFGVACVSGMLYKIVPFLMTLHLQRRAWRQGQRGQALPRLRDFIPERASLRQYRLFLAGLAALIVAVFVPERQVTFTAAITLASAWLFLLAHLYRALTIYRRHARHGSHSGAPEARRALNH